MLSIAIVYAFSYTSETSFLNVKVVLVPPNLKDSLIDFDEVTAGAWLLTVSGAFSFSANTWPLLIQIEGTADI